jgi:hypothetical protein
MIYTQDNFAFINSFRVTLEAYSNLSSHLLITASVWGLRFPYWYMLKIQCSGICHWVVTPYVSLMNYTECTQLAIFCTLHNGVQPFQSCDPTQRLQVLNDFLGPENLLHSIIHHLWNTCRNHLLVHSYHDGLHCYHNPGIMLSAIYCSGQGSREFPKF